jgi:ArsR family transcriptional regulator, virulence genes transcriptional regulator
MAISSTLSTLKSNSDPNALKIEVLGIKKAQMVLRALNHKLRMQIIQVIHQGGKVTVTDIYISMRLDQSVVSQHLAILRRVGIVKTQRSGKYVYYFINQERIDEIHNYCRLLVG